MSSRRTGKTAAGNSSQRTVTSSTRDGATDVSDFIRRVLEPALTHGKRTDVPTDFVRCLDNGRTQGWNRLESFYENFLVAGDKYLAKDLAVMLRMDGIFYCASGNHRTFVLGSVHKIIPSIVVECPRKFGPSELTQIVKYCDSHETKHVTSDLRTDIERMFSAFKSFLEAESQLTFMNYMKWQYDVRVNPYKTADSIRFFETEQKAKKNVPNHCPLSVFWNLKKSNSMAQTVFRGYKKLYDSQTPALIKRIKNHPSALSLDGNVFAQRIQGSCCSSEGWEKFVKHVMEGTIADFEQKIDPFNGSIMRSFRGSRKKTTDSSSTIQKKNTKADKEEAERNEKLRQMSRKYEAAEAKIGTLQAKIATYQANIATLQAEAKEKDIEVSAVKEELKLAKDRIAELESNIEEGDDSSADSDQD